MIQEFAAFFTLFRQGKELANAAAWKNRTIATNSVVAVLGAMLAIAKGFGYDIPLSNETIQALGAGIVAAVGAFNAVMHVISSSKVGLPPACAARPGGDAGAGSAPPG